MKIKKKRVFVNTPLTPMQYWGYSMLYSVPVLGFIMRQIHKRTSKNINLVNYAISYSFTFWIKFIIFAVIIVLMVALGFFDWLAGLIL